MLKRPFANQLDFPRVADSGMVIKPQITIGTDPKLGPRILMTGRRRADVLIDTIVGMIQIIETQWHGGHIFTPA